MFDRVLNHSIIRSEVIEFSITFILFIVCSVSNKWSAFVFIHIRLIHFFWFRLVFQSKLFPYVFVSKNKLINLVLLTWFNTINRIKTKEWVQYQAISRIDFDMVWHIFSHLWFSLKVNDFVQPPHASFPTQIHLLTLCSLCAKFVPYHHRKGIDQMVTYTKTFSLNYKK